MTDSNPTPDRAVSADGRWEIYDYGSLGWFVIDRAYADLATVAAILPKDAPGLTAAQVLAKWESEVRDGQG